MTQGVLLPVKAHARPWGHEWRILHVPEGETLEAIIAHVQPERALRHYYNVTIAGHLIPEVNWRLVRPRAGAEVRVMFAPRGSGGGRIAAMVGIAVLAIVVSIATAGVATPFIAGLGASALTASIAGGALAAVAATAVTVGGTMLVNHFLPAAVPQISSGIGNDSPTYSIEGARNEFRPWGVVPQLLGKFRITPAKAAETRETVGSDNYWRTILVWTAGPITLTDMRIGETPIANFQDVETEFRRGYQPEQITDKGAWLPLSGFPGAPAFGDTWTASAGGTVDGLAIAVGQTITFNGLAAMDKAAAWDLDQQKPFRLFPQDVHDEPLQVKLTSASEPQLRTTQAKAREIAIEVVFGGGLFHAQNMPPGKLADNQVNMRIEYSRSGANEWLTAFNGQIRGRQRTPLYWGKRWTVDPDASPNGAYDVRIYPTFGHDGQRNIAECYWIALRTIGTAEPLPVRGLAATAIRIRASGQLSGQLSELSAVGQTIAKTWDAVSEAWVWKPTSNPAALDRMVIQHAHVPYRLEDAGVDLAMMREWAEYCDANGLEYNGYLDSETTVGRLREDIGRMGHASPSLRDVKRSVVIERPQTVPVRMFTPRNTWGFGGELTYPEPPHAFRVAFVNAAKEYKVDEIVVYDDTHSDGTATLFERLEPPGLTDAAIAHKYARRELARRVIQRENVRFHTDFEFLACERGDLIAYQHDAMAVGLGSGRVVSLGIEAGRVATVTIDERVTMRSGESYVLRAKRVVDGRLRTDLYAIVGLSVTLDDVPDWDALSNFDDAPLAQRETTLQLANPPLIADAPAVGDMVAFGISGRETIPMVLKDIEPGENLTARLTCVPQLNYTDGPIPDYDARVTAPRQLPAPVVVETLSGATVMAAGVNRVLQPRVVFRLDPPRIADLQLIIHLRVSGTDAGWSQAALERRTVTEAVISGVDEGQVYDFRLQYLHRDYFTSPTTEITSHTVVGATADPEPLTGLTIATIGGAVLLRWDDPADLDVQIGGWIDFRHSPLLTGATWQASTSIGRSVKGDQTWAYLPLKPGTYFARVYDSGGRAASSESSITTEQISALDYAPVAEVVEHPAFMGVATIMDVEAGALHLVGGNTDLIVDWDATPNTDEIGGFLAAGSYRFAAGIDLGMVRTVRLTSHVLAQVYNAFDLIDSRTEPIDTWPDLDGSIGAPADAAVWFRSTPGNPSGSPVWGIWNRLDAQDVRARGLQFELRAWTTDPQYNIDVTELSVKAEEVV